MEDFAPAKDEIASQNNYRKACHEYLKEHSMVKDCKNVYVPKNDIKADNNITLLYAITCL